jgi:hypothetical protein
MSNLEYLAHRRRATWVAQLWITLQKVRQSFLAWIGATIAFGSQVKKAMEHVLAFDRIGLCAAPAMGSKSRRKRKSAGSRRGQTTSVSS